MMIEVNLLPAELRRVEHTPLPRFMVIIFGTAGIMVMMAFALIVNLRTVPDLEAKQSTIVQDIYRNQAQAAVYDKLQDEICDTKERKEAIAEVWHTRVMWSEKLAQLAQMTPPYLGFTEIRLEEDRSAGTGAPQETGGLLTIDSLCAGANLERVAEWRKIVEGRVRLTTVGDARAGQYFFNCFLDLLPTTTSKVDVKEEYVEKDGLKFTLAMPLKPPSARLTETIQKINEDMNKPHAPAVVPAAQQTVTPAATPAAVEPAPKTENDATPAAPADGAVKPAAQTPSGDVRDKTSVSQAVAPAASVERAPVVRSADIQ